jgi:hypothetical protein
MQGSSRPPKPKDLGIVGKDHLLERFIDDDCAPESFVYQREIGHDGVPYSDRTGVRITVPTPTEPNMACA